MIKKQKKNEEFMSREGGYEERKGRVGRVVCIVCIYVYLSTLL
jgi:hypothetical protein